MNQHTLTMPVATLVAFLMSLEQPLVTFLGPYTVHPIRKFDDAGRSGSPISSAARPPIATSIIAV